MVALLLDSGTMALLEDGPTINFLQKAVPLTPPDMIIH